MEESPTDSLMGRYWFWQGNIHTNIHFLQWQNALNDINQCCRSGNIAVSAWTVFRGSIMCQKKKKFHKFWHTGERKMRVRRFCTRIYYNAVPLRCSCMYQLRSVWCWPPSFHAFGLSSDLMTFRPCCTMMRLPACVPRCVRRTRWKYETVKMTFPHVS